MPAIGVWSWSFVGVTLAALILVVVIGALSEIVLPMTFAAVLAVCFRPLATALQRHRLSPAAAAGIIVLALLALAVGVLAATVNGVVDQADQIGDLTDQAIETAADGTDSLGIDEEAWTSVRTSIRSAAPLAGEGVPAHLVGIVDSVIALASGVVLGSLIAYYLLKDGGAVSLVVIERASPAVQEEVEGFLADACKSLRAYGKGRTVLSAIVSSVIGLVGLLMGLPLVFTIVVVNFVGGYIPYIGAFLGGGLAVVIALGDQGFAYAAVMLVVVLVANLVLENFVEPRVMGSRLDLHPLVVLVTTALGGAVGGVVGLILAVPGYVIARDGIARLRRRGVVGALAGATKPAVRAALE